MKGLISLVLAGMIVASCGDSTNSDGLAPGGAAGSNGEEVVTDSTPSRPPDDDDIGDDDDVGPTVTDVDEPASSEPPSSDASVTDPSVTDPSQTDSPVTDPPVTDAPAAASASPTDRVVRFFAGDGSPGSPWAPLGHWDGIGWRNLQFSNDGTFAPLPASPIPSVAVTSLDLPDGPSAVISGLALGGEEPYCVGEESGPLIALPADLPRTSVSTGYNAVAVTADWPLQPRAVRQAGLQVPEYQTIGASLLAGQAGNAQDGTVVQAVRVDLDGNGVEEVLVTYERQVAGAFGGDGDFTSIYARYPSSDGTVVDELVVSYVSSEPVDFPTPGRFTLAAVADLNADGVMEVMVRDLFWESGGMQVFSLVEGRLARVAGGGCGV